MQFILPWKRPKPKPRPKPTTSVPEPEKQENYGSILATAPTRSQLYEAILFPEVTDEDVESFPSSCPKCLSRLLSYRLYQGPFPKRFRDYLRWACQRCGYVWLSEAADYEDPANDISLFNIGEFTLASGAKTNFKIDCDALSDKSIAALAKRFSEILPTFGSVEGVPTGGLRLAEAMKRFVFEGATLPLIVDDVLTTGGSMEKLRAGRDAIGAVIFSRGTVPTWITSFAVVNVPSWLPKEESNAGKSE